MEYQPTESVITYTNGVQGALSHRPDIHAIVIGWNDMMGTWPGTDDLLELINLSFIVKAGVSAGDAVFRVEPNNPTFDLIAPENLVVRIELPVEELQLDTPQLEAIAATRNSSMDVSWFEVANAEGYVIQYSTLPDFPDTDATKTIEIRSGSETARTLTDLATNTTYFVRIKATAEGWIDSDWLTISKSSSFIGDFVVTTFSDWSTGVPYIHDLSLREALLLAKAGDAITFDAALFNDDGTAKADLVLQYGELVVKNSVQIIGNGVTIDASGMIDEEVNVSRVFNITGNATVDCEVELVGLTLTGGVTSTQGGALYAKNAQLTLTDVTFVGNTANYGGAMYFVDSTVVMTDCIMTDNHSKWGGAIYQNSGTLTSNGSNVIANNSATWGGAIYQADGNLSLDDVTISGNDSTYGGGLYQAKGTAILTANTKIFDNTANRSFGSAIVKAKDAVLTINNHDLDTALSLYLDEIERFR
ncbi:MAG: fibronectin type III domain-containing protein [Planctomycetaceae bacterium]|nr:fibronectin type III domain-containing protein [Planctomycetaceae bacterium]